MALRRNKPAGRAGDTGLHISHVCELSALL
jgi:hypothetical protein